jgi:hypothetical protein
LDTWQRCNGSRSIFSFSQSCLLSSYDIVEHVTDNDHAATLMKVYQRSPVRLWFLLVLAGAVVIATFVVHSIAASMYYQLNSKILTIAASGAAAASAEYLPMNPSAAIRVARSYANSIGVLPDEIMSVEVSPDRSMVTIRLERKLPAYVSILTVGLPGHEIRVTAWAQKHSNHQLSAALTHTMW